MKKILLVLNIIVCIFSIVYILRFFEQRSLNDIVSELEQLKGNYIFILSITFCSGIIGTITLMICFNNRVPLKKFFFFHAVDLAGDAVSRVTPTNIVVGDSYKALTFRKYGINGSASASALITFRLFCLLSNFSFFILCMILYGILGQRNNSFNAIILIVIGIMVMAAAAIFILKRNKHILILAQRIKAKLLSKPKLEPVYRKIESVFVTIRENFYSNRRKFFLVLALTTLQKFGGVFELFFLLRALDIQTSLYSCMIFEMGVIIMRLVFAAIPMQLGVEEVWNKVLLGLINISSPQTWLTVSIIRRSRMLIWIIYGFVFLLLLNVLRRSETKGEVE